MLKMVIRANFRLKFTNNFLVLLALGLFSNLFSGCYEGQTPAMNGTVFSSPTPLSTNSSMLYSPCSNSGYYADATSCKVKTGSTCSVLVLTSGGVSYACYSAASSTPTPSPTSGGGAPSSIPSTSGTTDSAVCAAEGGTWLQVPNTNNVYGCKYNGSNCGNSYTKMFAADLSASICNAPSTDIVQSSKKDGSKLCHNDWDGWTFKFRCTDNDPDNVKSECTGHIKAMNSNFFSVSTATYQGTYIFPSSSNTVLYPSTGKIPCYTKLYCDQNTTVGGWGNCDGAWGTACWPDFNANWLQNDNSNSYSTITSLVSSVYCGKN
jgi:hypothetical protein